MFQTFDTAGDPPDTAQRVKALRSLMSQAGIDALLVPRADAHQGEYVPACAERLRWLTGFSGSAGLAIVARKAAALIVDGRYTVQSRAEVDGGVFGFPDLPRGRIAEWIGDHLSAGQTVGFDPWLHTGAEIVQLREKLAAKRIALKPTTRNLVDRIWGKARPPAPAAPIVPHPMKHAGRGAADKIADVQSRLEADGHDAVVLTLPDSIAWAFNIRGGDVAHNPIALAFAVLPAKGKAELYVDAAKLGRDARAHLEPIARICEPGQLAARLKALRAAGRKVRLDTNTAAFALSRALGRSLVKGADPCIGLKARKSTAEIKGARAAHLRDGLAMARFLCWLDANATRGIDEIVAVTELERCRAETGALREISFDTISGSGPNGAIVHYRVTRATNRRLHAGELFLVDSGGQYVDGTTDITRTVAIGRPSAEMRDRFTRVLQGHIGIATARFPKGTRGIDLDPFARRALWDAGLDYDHDTGHGIGSFLSVHEGPQSISRAGMAELMPGMLVSNEPGYYKAGAYGIRIENVVLVTEPAIPDGGDRAMMGFETLTLAPIDTRLVVRDLLSAAEAAWLDGYHAHVREALAPGLEPAVRAWLVAATKPIG